MNKNITIVDARKMSKLKLQTELDKCAKQLETLGMSHEEACQFVSKVMSFGIAIDEKIHNANN